MPRPRPKELALLTVLALTTLATAQHTLRLDPARVRVPTTPLTAELGAEPRDYGPRCHDEPKRRLRALRYCAPSCSRATSA